MIYDFRFKKVTSHLMSYILNLTSNRGFTMLELLVAFSLVAMVSGIGFASFGTYSRRQVVVQAAADMKQAVETARFSALSGVRPAACGLGEQLASYTVSFCINNNPACSAGLNGTGYEIHASCGGERPLVLSKKLPQGLTLGVAGVNLCQDIIFTPVDSTVSGGPCDLRLVGNSNTVVFDISAQGFASYE